MSTATPEVVRHPAPETVSREVPAGAASSPPAGAARGKIVEVRPNLVIFQPRGTQYELHLGYAGDYTGPVGCPTAGVVAVRARKLYTVPSGGNFVAPILGSPRTIQGRVLEVGDGWIVLQAGLPVRVELPAQAHAVDLGEGPVEVGGIVNVVAMPGAWYEDA